MKKQHTHKEALQRIVDELESGAGGMDVEVFVEKFMHPEQAKRWLADTYIRAKKALSK
jgi:hypothetical protein